MRDSVGGSEPDPLPYQRVGIRTRHRSEVPLTLPGGYATFRHDAWTDWIRKTSDDNFPSGAEFFAVDGHD